MQQLDLLTIRKQPMQPAPKIPFRTIKAYVKQNLRDFGRRQAERERQRAEKRKRRKPRIPKPRTSEEHPHMRTIKVTYRAIFEQPIGPLNSMGVKLPGIFPVEIFGTGEKWQAREIASPNRHVYAKLDKFASLHHGMTVVEQSFERQIEPWQMWGTPPSEEHHGAQIGVERLLLPDEVCDLGNGKMGWRQAEDYTHIIHAPTIPDGARIPPAACGAKVKADCFISTKANVEPTCKECVKVWRREYKGK